MKRILFTITLLITLSSFGQNQKATLFFKNDDVLEGYAKIKKGGRKILFKTTRKSKIATYSSKEVDRIIIRSNDKDILFQYKILKNQKKITLLEPIIKGKVTLYRNMTQQYSFGIPVGGYGVGENEISSYYVSKNNEPVTDLGHSQSLKSFSKAASNFFRDCPTLVVLITKKRVKRKDIVDIVEYYNKNCGE
ncbi:MAG: hypothetical protein L3J14_08680 [Flavobacteriaceae bacterium]|nr:hypothetical protein [Flavobacteriaceae bacterium]